MAGNTDRITAAAVEQAVRQDAELAQAARALATKAIDIAHHYLVSGSPQMQLNVIKAIMPAIGRAMSDKGESEELALMRAELAELMTVMRGDSPAA